MVSLRLKKDKRKTRRNVTVRFSEEEYNNLTQKALVHTDGNVSEWLRYSGQNCTPRKKDFEKVKKNG